MSRLYRSTRDKVMTGLAGGVSETLGIDSTLFRILLLVSIPFTGGATILVYFVAALVIPKEPTQYNPFGLDPELRTALMAALTPEDLDMDAARKARRVLMDREDMVRITVSRAITPVMTKQMLTRPRTPVWMP